MSAPLNDDDLRAAYASRSQQAAQHTDACPAPEALLAAVRGEGDEAERLRVLDHALQCPACRPELALLHGVSGAGTAAAATSRYTWRRFAPLAAAAVVVLALGVAGVQSVLERRDIAITRAASGGEPVLIAPAAATVVSSGPVTFGWRAVPRALDYTIEVNAPDGTVVYTARTADTTIVATLPALRAGDNRWWVRAQLDDGTERRSEARLLRTR